MISTEISVVVEHRHEQENAHGLYPSALVVNGVDVATMWFDYATPTERIFLRLVKYALSRTP